MFAHTGRDICVYVRSESESEREDRERKRRDKVERESQESGERDSQKTLEREYDSIAFVRKRTEIECECQYLILYTQTRKSGRICAQRTQTLPKGEFVFVSLFCFYLRVNCHIAPPKGEFGIKVVENELIVPKLFLAPLCECMRMCVFVYVCVCVCLCPCVYVSASWRMCASACVFVYGWCVQVEVPCVQKILGSEAAGTPRLGCRV